MMITSTNTFTLHVSASLKSHKVQKTWRFPVDEHGRDEPRRSMMLNKTLRLQASKYVRGPQQCNGRIQCLRYVESLSASWQKQEDYAKPKKHMRSNTQRQASARRHFESASDT